MASESIPFAGLGFAPVVNGYTMPTTTTAALIPARRWERATAEHDAERLVLHAQPEPSTNYSDHTFLVVSSSGSLPTAASLWTAQNSLPLVRPTNRGF